MIRTAYLRVYHSVDDPSDWRVHVPTPAPARLITLGEIGVWQESLVEDAFRADWQGRRWVCPRHPRLRMLEGLLAFRNAYPGSVGTTLAPESVVLRAATELEAMREREPEVKSHILTSSWHVPLRWFAAFAPEERELDDSGGAMTIRYRTRLGQARRRLGDAIATLGESGFDDSVIGPIEDVVEWLDGFDDGVKMLELDYGSVAGLFSNGELALDESAADVAASLAALAEGDVERAGTFYANAAGRWANAQSVVFAN